MMNGQMRSRDLTGRQETRKKWVAPAVSVLRAEEAELNALIQTDGPVNLGS
jgi:hypothetical protein